MLRSTTHRVLFVGLGGLLFDNRPHIDPSAQDIANGYNEAYLAARVGTEFIAGVVTGRANRVLAPIAMCTR